MQGDIMVTKNELIVLYRRVLDYEKDPNPEHWRTISGAKVHLDQNGEIDGGAGGKFTGNYWDGKKGQQHVIGPHTMMKKNIGSGATNVMLAAGGFLGNALGKTQKEPPKQPAKKPKAPKEPAFVFPQEMHKTTPKPPKNIHEHMKRNQDIDDIVNRSSYRTESHPYIRIRLEELADLMEVPLEELQAPKTPEQMEKQLGSAFARANNAKKKKFGKVGIEQYKKALDALKKSDSKIAETVLCGINVKTLDQDPVETYNMWLAAAAKIERLNEELKTGITTNYEEWKKATKKEQSHGAGGDFWAELGFYESEENLKRQAKIYKPDQVVGVPKGPDMDFQNADHKTANPNYRSLPWDKDYKKGFTINCQTCVIAYEMRRRGYNVEAMARDAGNKFQDIVAGWGTGLDDDGSAKAWIRPDGTHPIPKELGSESRDDQYKWLSNGMEEGGRYTFCFCWKRTGAHIIHAFKENGVAKLYDPQNGQLVEEPERVKSYLDGIAVNAVDKKGRKKPNPRLTRIDDCAPNMFYVNRVLKPAT